MKKTSLLFFAIIVAFASLVVSCSDRAPRQQTQAELTAEANEKTQIEARAAELKRQQDSITVANKPVRFEDDTLVSFKFLATEEGLTFVHPQAHCGEGCDSLDQGLWQIALIGEGQTAGGLNFKWDFSSSVNAKRGKIGKDSLLNEMKGLYKTFSDPIESPLIAVSWKKEAGSVTVYNFFRKGYEKNIKTVGKITTSDGVPQLDFKGFGFKM